MKPTSKRSGASQTRGASATENGHAKNFSIALSPGGRFRMTPLYDVVTVQPTLDASQLNRRDMKLAMGIGNNNHYRVHDIAGRHFVETGTAAGLSKTTIHEIIAEIVASAEGALTRTIDELPQGFPACCRIRSAPA